MTLPVGTQISGYTIERVLGRGGSSVVYLAAQTRLERRVALKVLSPDLSQDEVFRKRFIRESQLAASLQHPHIIPIYEADEIDGQLYIVMPFIESDLTTLLQATRRLEDSRVLTILRQTARALDAAHRRDLVHRDVKPANILLTPRGDEGEDHAYLADFGITKRTSGEMTITQVGEFVGSVRYIAPEQIMGKVLTHKADIYSLGCVAYECFAGRAPFHREHEAALIYAHLHDDAPPLAETRPPVHLLPNLY
jgi:serine/threonine-protein kinase